MTEPEGLVIHLHGLIYNSDSKSEVLHVFLFSSVDARLRLDLVVRLRGGG